MSTKEITKRVIDEWDPINLFPSAPANEYEPEINEIVLLLNKTNDHESVAVGIHQIFTDWFTANTFARDINECREVADKIIAQIK